MSIDGVDRLFALTIYLNFFSLKLEHRFSYTRCW